MSAVYIACSMQRGGGCMMSSIRAACSGAARPAARADAAADDADAALADAAVLAARADGQRRLMIN